MKKEKIYRLSITGIMIAILIIMAFTPLGYLKIGVLSITFLTIPIIIGAVTNGPVVGAILGLCFGITSFVQCFGMDAFGTALMQISVWKTAVMCLVPRILIGVICGFVYKGLSKTKMPAAVQYGISAFSAPLTNTILFMSCLMGFFWGTKLTYVVDGQSVEFAIGGMKVFQFLFAMVGVNGIVELAVCTVLGTLILIPLQKAVSKYQLS
ncbi:MAG: ECF transporter S component [Clostridia bacterium]|nr:ECF transporter S component [Clostridia bacterium]